MTYREFAFTTADGIRLAGRDYGSRSWTRTPVVCLAGLTRNAADFDVLASHLSEGATRRRVVALDMRGRGGSQNDPKGEYELTREASDALDGIVAAGLHDVAIVGTSRGAILAMAIAAMRPGILRGVVMNDLGPVIEGPGLVQIKGYLSRLQTAPDWKEAEAQVRRLFAKSFPALTDDQWHRVVRALYHERDGKLVMAHDPAIHRTLDAVEDGGPPPMWAAFAGLRNVPVLSIRGELSSLFSAATQQEMARRHPDLQTYVVPGQGHAPLLDDEATIGAIAAFLERKVDRASPLSDAA